MQDEISVWESYRLSDRIPFCLGDKVPVQSVDRRGRGEGSGLGEGDLRSVRDPDHQGSGQPGSRAYHGEQSPDAGAE